MMSEQTRGKTEIEKAVRQLRHFESTPVDEYGADANPVLVRELMHVTRAKRRFGIIQRCLAVPLIVYVLAQVFGRLSGHHFSEWFIVFEWTFIGIGALASASAYQKNLVGCLYSSGDCSAIGPLAETMWIAKIDRDIVLKALSRLLPQMRASDVNLVTQKQRASLYAALKLKPSKNSDFMVVLLNALEQIGDEAAIPYVERLADRPAKGDKALRVQQAARECLPALRDLVRRQHEENTLLRPAAESDELLRPASVTSADTPEQLLRATIELSQ